MNKKLVVIGGGIIGITIARNAALKNLFSDITVIEKEINFGIHSSTRNSGVIHAGFYYYPESFKAKFCAEGNKLMRDYCLKKNIKVNRCGKVVVTKNQKEEKILEELYKRGIKNGSELYLLEKDKIIEYEPYAKTYNNFLWSPNTWTTSPKQVFNYLLSDCKALGIKLINSQRIRNVTNSELFTREGNTYSYDYVINAAGGYALEVSKLFGLGNEYSVLPFKGLYLKSKFREKKFSKNIYPVPDISQPFLGIHTTITSENYLKLGPTAIPVFSPDNYKFFDGLDWKISKEIISLQIDLFLKNKFGFRDLAFKEIKFIFKQNIIDSANQLTNLDLNKIKFTWHSPGIRPQLFNKINNKLENDFVLEKGGKSIHILNSISPAWTCCFKTADHIVQEIKNHI